MTSTLSVSPELGSRPGARPTSFRRFAAPSVGLLAALLSFTGSWIPSYWGDEAASVISAQRTLPSLFTLLTHIDAVHGTYYLFLHFWIGLVGDSEIMVRLPSAVAIGVAAAGVVVLGRQLYGTPTGVVAGLIFAIIPQVTKMGAEARAYAFTMAAAVWLTHWLIALVRRRERRSRSWVLYSLGVAAALYLFLYLALLLLVHTVVVLAFRPGREVVRSWLRALTLAVVLALPIIVLGFLEREQIAFLARRDYATVTAVLGGQWFSSVGFAVLAWALIVAGIVATLRLRRGSLPWRGGIVMIAWLVLPTAVLLMANAWVTPVYTERYLSFCAPAVAILMAVGVRWILTGVRGARLRRIVAAAIALILVLLAAPNYWEQRGPYGKDGGSDFRQVAEVIAANASPGDAVIFDESVRPSRKPRLAIDLYPASFRGLQDIALRIPYERMPTLWDEVAPLSELGEQLEAHPVVWVVETNPRSPDVAALKALGYVVDRTIPISRDTVIRLSRSTP